jgi:hypothetical protein
MNSVMLGLVQEKSALNQRLGMFHIVHVLFLNILAQPIIVPVLAHLSMEKLLVDRRQFFLQSIL